MFCLSLNVVSELCLPIKENALMKPHSICTARRKWAIWVLFPAAPSDGEDDVCTVSSSISSWLAGEWEPPRDYTTSEPREAITKRLCDCIFWDWNPTTSVRNSGESAADKGRNKRTKERSLSEDWLQYRPTKTWCKVNDAASFSLFKGCIIQIVTCHIGSSTTCAHCALDHVSSIVQIMLKTK